MTASLVVDAHHHLWDPSRAEYPWMTAELAAIRRPFGPEDLRGLIAANGVDRTIVVQARSSLEETRELLEIAERTHFISGVIGWVDLAAADVERSLASLRQGPGGRFLVGIRHQVHDEPDPSWLLNARVRRGLEAVGEAGLAYDLLVRAAQLPTALQAARQLSDLSFVIDHLAKPAIAAGHQDHAWAEAMAPFSDLPNVCCKLSGMVTEAEWKNWTVDDLLPYVERCVGWFGEDRLLFGSDWPVCLLAADYARVVASLREILAGMPRPAREKVFGANAVTLYGLERLI